MRKIALFVEGNTELVFVREYLLKHFEYQNIDLECRTLFKHEKLLGTDFDFPNNKASYHFQIINVGSDSAVLPRILQREQLMWNAGYEFIIGLRDMYSDEYIEAMKQPRKIKPEINDKFIKGYNQTVNLKASKPNKIQFCFAIMETEAWFLGISEIWKKKRVSEKIQSELLKTDPEITYLHPKEKVKEILKTVNQSYGTHDHEVNSLIGNISKDDFKNLLQSSKCNSFKVFNDNLFQKDK